MFTVVASTLEQDGQKSGGDIPPGLKSGGVTGSPDSTTYEYEQGLAGFSLLQYVAKLTQHFGKLT